MSEELKPADCPFCGSSMEGPHTSDVGVVYWMHPGVVTDGQCFFSGQGIYAPQLHAWNRRSSPPQNDAGGVYAKDRDKIAALIDPGIFKRELPKRHDDARRAQAYRKADEIIAALRAPMSELQALGQEFEAGEKGQ